MNVYGWTKNQVDIRNIFFKNTYGLEPSQWVALKFFNVYGINEFHKKDMISIVLKTFLQIKIIRKQIFLSLTKKNIRMEIRKEILFTLKIVLVLYCGFWKMKKFQGFSILEQDRQILLIT